MRVEIERNELIANTTQNLIPYELTAGNQIGKNYFWRLNFDYKLSSFLQTTISYDGSCLLYTSDAAEERSSVDLGGRRLLKKKNQY